MYKATQFSTNSVSSEVRTMGIVTNLTFKKVQPAQPESSFLPFDKSSGLPELYLLLYATSRMIYPDKFRLVNCTTTTTETPARCDISCNEHHS